MISPVTELLLIDDDEVDRKAVARALRTLGPSYRLREARDGRSGLELAASQSFDCILLDYNLPDMTGVELLVALRERESTCVPVVILTGTGNESVAVEAMKRGAHDYLLKAQLGPDMLFRAVANAIEKASLECKLREAQRKLERLAHYDVLTGLGNRNLFHNELARTIAGNLEGSSFPLLMMDLDHFKAANDTFGHEAGDAILADVGARLRELSRGVDAFFRLGGDEFIAILHRDSDGRGTAQRIIATIAQPFPFASRVLFVGISVGVVSYPADGGNAKDIVRAADKAMYRAKRSELRWAVTDATAYG